MTLLQIDSITTTPNPVSGFMDNYFWPLVVILSAALILGVVTRIRKQFKKRQKAKKDKRPTIKLYIDKNGDILPISDDKFATKIQLAKQITKTQRQKGLLIDLIPNYVTGHIDKYAKNELELKLKNKANEIEKKIEILLMRPIEPGLEHPNNLKTVINRFIAGQPFNVSGRVKIDIYRTYAPKINFPVYVTDKEFQKMAEGQNKTTEELKKKLLIPTMCSTSIFNNGLLYSQVIPALVQEIYRIHSRYDFDLKTKHWENILLYEVGLG